MTSQVASTHGISARAVRATLPLVNGAVCRRPLTSGILEGNGHPLTHSHTTAQTLTDYEDVLRQTQVGEIGVEGGRRVENFLPMDWNDFTFGVAGDGAYEISDDGLTLTCTVTASGRAIAWYDHNEVIGESYILSATVRVISGSPSVPNIGWWDVSTGFTLPGGANGRYQDTRDITVTQAEQPRFGVGVNANETSGCVVEITFPQLENSTGRSDIATASEYVNRSILSAPYHGANVDGVQWFTYANGNSVASNVVTEARGTDLTTIKGVGIAPVITNLIPYSSDFSSWPTTSATVTSDTRPAADGFQTADTIASNSSLNDEIRQPMTLGATTDYNFSTYIENNNAEKSYIAIWDNTGATWNSYIIFEWTAGVPSTDLSLGATNIKYEQIGSTNIYRISYSLTTSANTDYSLRLRPAYTGSSVGDSVYAWGAQLTASPSILPYVPSDGSATTQTANSLSIDEITGMLLADAGTISMTFTSYHDASYFSSSHPIVSFGSSWNNGIVVGSTGVIKVNMFLGGVTITTDVSIVAGTEYKVSVNWGDGEYKVFVNGVEKGSTTYTTQTWLPDSVNFGASNDVVFYIEDFVIRPDKVSDTEALRLAA